MTRQVLTQVLPCTLSDDEIRHKGSQLAALLKKRDEIAIEQKMATSQTRELTKQTELEITELSTQIHTRQEKRDVEVIERRDYFDRKVETVRADTGDIVSIRPMHPTEQQKELALGVPADEAAAEETLSA